MKKHFFTLVAFTLLSISLSAATVYTRVTKFDKIGTNFCDTFLICCEHAGNLYIFDSNRDQEVGGKSYEAITNFSGNKITGSHAIQECIIEHNSYHKYDKLCSIRCFGDGDRVDKGGYYLAGVGGGNGISYSNGQTDVEIVWQGEMGIDITTKSGAGNFQFNSRDKVFKFYKECKETRPILFVKGNGGDYVGEDESANDLDINYVQADLYSRYSDYTKNLYGWDLTLAQHDSEDAVPMVYMQITTATRTSLKNTYTINEFKLGQVGNIYKSNSNSPKITFPSKEGSTQANLNEATLTLTPVSKYDEKWYNYHIELYCIDSNKKRWKLDKVLPIMCTFTDRDPNNKEYDLETDYAWVMEEKVPTAIQMVTMDDLNLFAVNGIIYGAENMKIYTVTGMDVTSQNGALNGIYIVKMGDKTAKVVVK